MKLTQLLLLTVLSVAFALPASAQSKYTKDADAAFNNKEYFNASKSYKSVYSKIKDLEEKGRVCYRIAECYRYMTRYEDSEEWYEKAITAQYYKHDMELYYNYGEALRHSHKFEDAVVQYNKFIDKGGDKDRAQARIDDCEMHTMHMLEPPTRYIVEPMVTMNSPGFDYSPHFSGKKDDEIVFSSTRQASTGSNEDPHTGESFADLFTTSRDKKGKWSTPVPLNNTINTESNEGAACFDSKKKIIYFTKCLYEKKDKMACDVYTAKRSGANYQAAEPLGILDRTSNDTSQVGHPALTPDDLNMVFASNMPGGYGGKDLWMITYNKKEKRWSDPVNLGEGVNTSGDEMFPYVKADGTLYFASNGHVGLGGMDIFSAENLGENKWGNPTNLQYPINSSSDDFGIIYEKDKDQGYFTSNRPGGKGQDDIYSFKMPPVEFALIGTVYNDETGVPLADAAVVVQGSDGGSYQITTDGNGGFSLSDGEIKAESNYSVDVSLEGYIGTGDQFSTVGLTESTTFAREYFLKEIVKDKEYKMPLVLYPFDKAELLVDDQVNSKDSLSYLLDLMQRNPTFVIQLEAHTDARGSAKYNHDLSQRRAETCVKFLIENGIAADRLVAVGQGEDIPLITEAEINAMATEEEKEAAHQVNRRTVFKIISYDYVPPAEE